MRRKIPDIESLHRDVGFGVQFRLELDKLVLTLASALFAFSTSYVPTLRTVMSAGWLAFSWVSLAVSVAGGVFELLGWEKFYLSYRDFNHKGKVAEGESARKRITSWRRVARGAQLLGFVAGVVGMAVFYAINFRNIALEKP